MKIEQFVSELESKIRQQQEEILSLKSKGMHFGQKYWYLPYCIFVFFGAFILLWAVLQ